MIRTEHLLKDLFENPRNIVLVTDENFVIRYASNNVETILGVNAFSLLGQNAFRFISPATREEWEQTGRREITLDTRDGRKVYFDVTITNHAANESIRGLVIFLYDVTQRKLDHVELENENHQLDHFIYKTTHDLKAPVHSALGLINLALTAPSEQRDEYIRLIRQSLIKLDELIEDVSSFYKNDKLAITQEPIDLDNMIREEIDLLKDLPEAKDIHFKMEIADGIPVCSDRMRVKTILSNVLSNSIKYSDRSKSARFIHVKTRVSETDFQILISDNGIGIEKENIGKIFDLFFRASTASAGTGLGLHIVKDTVQRLNGTITVDSMPQQGTTFSISLPNCVKSAIVQN